MKMKSSLNLAIAALVVLSPNAHAQTKCTATLSSDSETIDIPCLISESLPYYAQLKSTNNKNISLEKISTSELDTEDKCIATLEHNETGTDLYIPCIKKPEGGLIDGLWRRSVETSEFKTVWISSGVTEFDSSTDNYKPRAVVSTSSIDAWVQKSTGVCKDMDGSYGCQCVDLMHDYIQNVLGVPRTSHNIRGNAYNIYNNIPSTGKTISHGNVSVGFSKINNTPTGVPQKGDIIFWKPSSSNGQAGHVAIYLNGNADSFTSIDQNWINASLSKGSKAAIVTHNYTSGGGVAGWLRPNVSGSIVGSNTPPTLSQTAPATGTAFPSATSQVPLSWTASSDATNFRVVVSTKEDFSGFNDDLGSSTCDSSCFTWGTASTSGVFTQAIPGQTYYWKIRANNSNASVASSFTEAWSFSTNSNVEPQISGEAADILNGENYTDWVYYEKSGIWYITSIFGTTYALGRNSKNHAAWISIGNGIPSAEINWSTKTATVNSRTYTSNVYEAISLVDGTNEMLTNNAASSFASNIEGQNVPFSWYFFRSKSGSGKWYIADTNQSSSTILGLKLTSDGSNYDWQTIKNANGSIVSTLNWSKDITSGSNVKIIRFRK